MSCSCLKSPTSSCRERRGRAARPRWPAQGLVEEIPINAKVESLAQAYIDSGALSPSRRADATHIAAATVARADLILSWNFQHIVNFNRIHKFKGVNLQNGYPAIEIFSPMEFRDDEQD